MIDGGEHMSNQLPEPKIQIALDKDNVKIHTFISPEAFLANATHVIEGPKELVIIDGQFVVPFAMGFRAYIDSLGKPINRIYLSHDHVDHFFGISAAFGDVPIYALPETIEFLKENGEELRQARQAVYGDFVPKQVVIPTDTVQLGKEVIDGLTYEHEVIKNGEVETQLAIKLPELNVYIVQDLIYSGGHIYIHSVEMAKSWIQVLEKLKASGCEVYLPGHGEPADVNEVQANIDYLQKAIEIIESSADVESYKAAILEAFPNKIGEAIIDIYAPILFQ